MPTQKADAGGRGNLQMVSEERDRDARSATRTLEVGSRAELRAALDEYAQAMELALAGTERRRAELAEAAGVLLKRIEIAQCYLENMSWWDHLWTVLRRPPPSYRRWAEADGEVDEAFGAMERVLHDSDAPGPSDRQRMRRDIATAYGRIIDLLATRSRKRRPVARAMASDVAQGLSPLAKGHLSKA